MNAAGWAKTVEQVRKLAAVPVLTHIVVGSFTLDAREGNTGGTNFAVAHDGTSVNSLGLPNGGLEYLKHHGEEMVSVAHDAGKKLVVSIAGFKPEEYGILAAFCLGMNADVIEINAGCPNVHDGGKQKIIASFAPELLLAILAEVRVAVDTETKWWLKVSPTSNPLDREWIAAEARVHNCKGLVVANTFPNVSLYHPDGRPYLDVANNYAGMAGTGLRDINLSQCRHYKELLPDMPIIGVGGVSHGRDLRDYHRWCQAIQVGTHFFRREDPRVFEGMVAEYVNLPG